eukprot:2967814-Prymnesium_polylepis.2
MIIWSSSLRRWLIPHSTSSTPPTAAQAWHHRPNGYSASSRRAQWFESSQQTQRRCNRAGGQSELGRCDAARARTSSRCRERGQDLAQCALAGRVDRAAVDDALARARAELADYQPRNESRCHRHVD